MQKPLKVILLLLGTCAALLLSVALVFGLVFSSDTLKSEVVSWVKQRTGRELSVTGDVGLSLYPVLGLSVGKVALGNAPQFPGLPFAEIAGADIGVKWLSLVNGSPELSVLQVHGLVLNLAKNARGENNWADLLKPPPLKGDAVVLAKVPLSDSDRVIPVHSLNIDSGVINWNNQQTGQAFILNELYVNADAEVVSKPINVALGFQVKSDDVIRKVDMSAHVHVDNALSRFNLDEVVINGMSADATNPGERLAVAGAIKNLEYQQQQQTVSVSGLQLTSHNMSLSADFTGQPFADHPELKGSLQVADFSVKEFMQQHAMSPPLTVDPSVLSHCSANATWHATEQGLNIDDLHMVLDQTQLQGVAEVKDFAHPVINFSAEVDSLDADRYFASADGVPAPVLSSAVVLAVTDQAVSPLTYLKSVQLNGKLLLHTLKMNNLALQEVSLAFQGKDGQLHTQQAIPQVYQGSYEGNASLTLDGEVSRVTVAEKVVHLNLERLLAAVHSPIQLSGLADVSAQLQGQGNTVAALKASMTGDLQFLVESGAIKGFNLQQLLENLPVLLQGAPIPEQFVAAQTVFSQLKGTAKMSNGVLVNQNLVAASPLVAVNGKGSLDLNTSDITYTLKAQLLNGITPVKALKDWPLSLKVSGSLTKPVYTVDNISGFVEESTTQLVEKKTELLKKLDTTLQKKLGMGSSELVKKLF